MSVYAVIPAAGTGERFGAAVPKPLVDLCGRPVIAHTLAVFEQCAGIDGIILVVHPRYHQEYSALVARYGFTRVTAVVDGGSTRSASVRNALRALPAQATCVIVHDSVRPLVTPELIRQGLALAALDRAVIAAVPVKPSIKLVDPHTHLVRETLDRSLVWDIQTPQVFERSLLERAHAQDVVADDDAALVEKCGVPVRVYMGDYKNIKITTAEDLLVARAFMEAAVKESHVPARMV